MKRIRYREVLLNCLWFSSQGCNTRQGRCGDVSSLDEWALPSAQRCSFRCKHLPAWNLGHLRLVQLRVHHPFWRWAHLHQLQAFNLFLASAARQSAFCQWAMSRYMPQHLVDWTLSSNDWFQVQTPFTICADLSFLQRTKLFLHWLSTRSDLG